VRSTDHEVPHYELRAVHVDIPVRASNMGVIFRFCASAGCRGSIWTQLRRDNPLNSRSIKISKASCLAEQPVTFSLVKMKFDVESPLNVCVSAWI
jgi:hypothetical protein